jgi:hypothetical protein
MMYESELFCQPAALLALPSNGVTWLTPVRARTRSYSYVFPYCGTVSHPYFPSAHRGQRRYHVKTINFLLQSAYWSLWMGCDRVLCKVGTEFMHCVYIIEINFNRPSHIIAQAASRPFSFCAGHSLIPGQSLYGLLWTVTLGKVYLPSVLFHLYSTRITLLGRAGWDWKISNRVILCGLSDSITEECLKISTVDKLNQYDQRE